MIDAIRFLGPSILAFATLGFAVTVVATRFLIGWLSARQLGKAIRVDGPDHQAKSGTPTMGGMGMLLALVLAAAWQAWIVTGNARPVAADAAGPTGAAVLLLISAPIVFAAFGLIDDLQGLARKSGGRELGVGLGARQMIALQAVAGIGLAWLASSLPLARQGLPDGTPRWLVGLLFALVIVGCVNGVNMSDGLDGLAAGLIGLAAASIGIAVLLPFSAYEASVAPADSHLTMLMLVIWFAFAIAGACLGFLVFNRHPARVFMGNVASMGLGGALAMLFVVSGYWWLLPVIGLVFVAEVLSVILQVGYFKRTGGERIFRMAPLHHHFELGGMPETQVVRRFWAAGLVAGVAGILLAWLALR